MAENIYYIYLLASGKNGTLYIGITNDLMRRLYEHKNNLIKGFTSKYKIHNLVHFEEKPIGTLTLFQTGNVMGIHGVGVIPEMRKKGFAEEIMKFAINEAIDVGCEYAQLQASALGKGIYTRLGFEDLFLITNYQLK